MIHFTAAGTTVATTTSPDAPTTFVTSTGVCPTDNTCLQTSDFGVVDNSDWKVDLVLETLTSNTVSAYSTAVSKWQGLITGDVASISTSGLNSDSCARAYPAVIDDIHICAKDEPIEGPGKILGSAGPSYLRSSDGTSISGNMRFDSADVQGLITGGNWEAVILHEMGHIIGIGTLWDYNGVVTGSNPYQYLGGNAINVWKNDWQCSTDAPPVETDGGGGTAGGHWDDACMLNEFMTGYLSNTNVISKLTIATLADIGYSVDYTQAEPYDGYSMNNNVSGCCKPPGTRKQLRQLQSTNSRKPLSPGGKAEANAYGRKILKERDLPPGLERETDGALYVGDMFVSVLVEENGEVYEVDVEAADLFDR
mmetsp:Transcript_6358/g.10053  ORF Transcript_6358/g.10053 Transcript_6358/m.10053 type:complete len:366 (-) Transcript_6358:184-1281(-)